MTVVECAQKMLEHFMPGMNSRGSPELEAEKAAKAVIVDLRALVYAESVRAAAIARNITQGETGMHYGEETAKKILATSPGKEKR